MTGHVRTVREHTHSSAMEHRQNWLKREGLPDRGQRITPFLLSVDTVALGTCWLCMSVHMTCQMVELLALSITLLHEA